MSTAVIEIKDDILDVAVTYAKELGNDKIVDMLNNAKKYRQKV